MSLLITKSDGTTEEFKKQKLVASLQKAGADAAVAERIAGEVEQDLSDGVATSEIYSRAFARLRREKRSTAARYSLKRAVLEFGPSGFPFEAYIAELFRAEGYTAQIDQVVQGACVDHEVDVVANKGGEIIFAEAKFHNTPGFKSDLKTALYVKARMDDLQAAGHTRARGIVVTNTKFTSKAVQYAECAHLELLGWDYPQGRSLHERIDAAGVYPVTALTTLSKREKMALLSERKVLCKSLPNETDALSRAGVSGKRAEAALAEVSALCIPGKDI